MAVPQEKVAVHTTVASIALPEKAAYSKLSDTIATTPGTLTPVASTPEKSLEMPRDSNLSTPRSYRNENPFDTDIEAMITTTSSSDPYAMKSISTTKDCPTIWPGKQDWKAKAKAAKRDRGSCACMARMSKKNRIIMKVAIGLLVIGVGVGVGFGVSKPLGAPIWGTPDGNK
ncbi:hypothetical protein CPAR01_08116 [Colletotrichum paranaense]|uniref:Uncharacterized protein n=12 Tax=Colletotrichum acutatum species complex TaxID=2707335 RepID=A0A010QGC8_9PEZI|nr:uncharacterized protein HER10_EVM0008234 [Colletotrichum scovillei]XP_049143784.1 uncharacterized protein CLUP02_07647 [Colletotrichum lupini]XP_060320152.1 uncharacterized protein CCOS01_00517 [Colletotrichum costaricense]XP_060348755.1 uncharacterized protein CPAR01_08116 [Colletotrichum paranaense]XP_060366644.1 uncharacterized protein BDZ83DRAFT_256153 [Colletotrichum acutatum]XP_060377237.1 uncharacterized protein CTAM01_12097 [Colletotrichum tamarilloi]XP_060397615.1 uncharacterized 